MTTTAATSKQIDYLLTLTNQAHGTSHRYLSQARNLLALSSFQVERLTKADASRLIDQMQSRCGK